MRIITVLVALALAFSLAFSASAQQVHEVGVWISQPVINSTNELENLPLAFTLDEQTGFGVGSRRTFNDRWALSLDAIKVQADATLSDGDETVADLGKLSFVQLGAVAQLRLFRHAWVGAGAAYVRPDDLSSDDLDDAGIGTIGLDAKVGGIVAAGFDVPLSRRVSLAFDARYMPLELRATIEGDEERSTITVDPLIVSAGIRFRL